MLFLGSVILFNFFWRNFFWTFFGKENPKRHLILALSIYKVGSLFGYIYIYKRENIRPGRCCLWDLVLRCRPNCAHTDTQAEELEGRRRRRARFLASFPFLSFLLHCSRPWRVRKEEEEVVPRERSTVVVLVVVQMVLLPRSPQRICGMQLGGGWMGHS